VALATIFVGNRHSYVGVEDSLGSTLVVVVVVVVAAVVLAVAVLSTTPKFVSQESVANMRTAVTSKPLPQTLCNYSNPGHRVVVYRLMGRERVKMH